MSKKKDREIIFDKFNGRCAYCGVDLKKGWHVDHVKPIKRRLKQIDGCWYYKGTDKKLENEYHEDLDMTTVEYRKPKLVPDGYYNPENDTIENKMPSCPSCNINKHSMPLEDFRNLISGFIVSLNRDSTQYKIAKRYGLISENIKPVVFLFEEEKL